LLILGIASDGLFTVDEQYEIGQHVPNSQVVIIESGEGHDGFLLEFVQMRNLISAFIQRMAPSDLNPEFDNLKQHTDEELVSKPSLFGEAEGDLLLW
jgi:homoserine O-acetyltransferase/O-succinyltransferase